MLRFEFLKSLTTEIVSVIDRYGNQCSADEVIEFIAQATQVAVSELGRQTFFIFDAQLDPHALGLNPSYIVMLSLNSELPLLTLNAQPQLRLAS